MAFHLLLQISPASPQHTRVSHRAITWLREVSATGWRDRVGWGGQQAGRLRWTNKPGAVGCPTRAPHEPTYPLRGCKYTARVLWPRAKHPSAAPFLRVCFPGSGRQHRCVGFGMPPSSDGGSADPRSFRLSYSFASLLPPRERWKWQRGGNKRKSCAGRAPPARPHGVQLPPAGRGFQLAASGARLGQTGTGGI